MLNTTALAAASVAQSWGFWLSRPDKSASAPCIWDTASFTRMFRRHSAAVMIAASGVAHADKKASEPGSRLWNADTARPTIRAQEIGFKAQESTR
jgi:hypothetical protein